MRPATFNATLFVMAAACVLVALGEGSLGWFVGGMAFLGLGLYARRQRRREQEPGYEPGLGVGRFVFVLAILGVGIYGIYWLANAG